MMMGESGSFWCTAAGTWRGCQDRGDIIYTSSGDKLSAEAVSSMNTEYCPEEINQCKSGLV